MITVQVGGKPVTVEKGDGLALVFDFNSPLCYRLKNGIAGEALHAMHDRIAELEAQLSAVGAGGVTAGVPLMARSVELGPDGKEWAKTLAGYAHVETMLPRADGEALAPFWYGWALRGAFVAGAEWQESRAPVGRECCNEVAEPAANPLADATRQLVREADSYLLAQSYGASANDEPLSKAIAAAEKLLGDAA